MTPDALHAQLEAFLAASDDTQAMEYVQTYPQTLLTTAALDALTALADAATDLTRRAHMQTRQRLLQAAIDVRNGVRNQLLTLGEALITWVQTPDWLASEAYLQEHAAALVTDHGEVALRLLLASNDHNQTLAEHLTLLQRCREVGIAGAYAEFHRARQANAADLSPLMRAVFAFVQAESEAAARQLLDDQRQMLLTPEAEEMLRAVVETIRQQDNQALLTRAATRLALWQEVHWQQAQAQPEPMEPLRHTAFDSDRGQRSAVSTAHTLDPQALAQLLHDWIRTDTWVESAAFLQTHEATLCTAAAEAVLRQLLEAQANHPHIAQHLALLQRCSQVGIAEAYRPLTDLAQHPTAAALTALFQVTSAADLQRVLDEHPVLLDLAGLTALAELIHHTHADHERETTTQLLAILALLSEMYHARQTAEAAREAYTAFVALHDRVLPVAESMGVPPIVTNLRRSACRALAVVGEAEPLLAQAHGWHNHAPAEPYAHFYTAIAHGLSGSTAAAHEAMRVYSTLTTAAQRAADADILLQISQRHPAQAVVWHTLLTSLRAGHSHA